MVKYRGKWFHNTLSCFNTFGVAWILSVLASFIARVFCLIKKTWSKNSIKNLLKSSRHSGNILIHKNLRFRLQKTSMRTSCVPLNTLIKNWTGKRIDTYSTPMWIRAVEPEPNKFLMARAKKFWIVVLELEIWVPVQASYINNAMLFRNKWFWRGRQKN